MHRTGIPTAKPHDPACTPLAISPERFSARYRGLILIAWLVTPLLALPFLLFIGTLTQQQMWRVLVTPIESAYLLGSMFCALACYGRYNLMPAVDRRVVENTLRWLARQRDHWDQLAL